MYGSPAMSETEAQCYLLCAVKAGLLSHEQADLFWAEYKRHVGKPIGQALRDISASLGGWSV